jgi:hypothetical protein
MSYSAASAIQSLSSSLPSCVRFVVLTWYNVLADDTDADGCEVEEVELEETYPVDGGRPAALVEVVELEEAVESNVIKKKIQK